MKRTNLRRNLFIGVLMGLVMVLGVLDTADALTLTRVSDQYQSKRLGSTFEITFSVGLTSPTIAYDTARKRVSDHNDQSTPSAAIGRIDSSGYRVFDATNGREYRLSADASALTGGFVGPLATYETNSSGDTLPTAQLPTAASGTLYVDTGKNVVNAAGVPVYTRTGTGARAVTGTPADPWKYTRAKADPDDPIDDEDRFDFNEESISVAVTTGTAANVTITDKRDGQPAATMIETAPFAQLRSSVTLVCKVSAVGTYVVTITDTTIDDDFPAGPVPTKQSITFTLYVTDQAPAPVSGTNSIVAPATRVDTGLEKEPVSSRFTVEPSAGNLQVRYRVVEGNGTLYVGNEELTQGNPTPDLTVHQSTEVWINMNQTTNKVTATLQGGDPNVNTFQASIVFEYTGTDRRDPTPRAGGNQQQQQQQQQQVRTPSLSISVSGTGTTRSVTVTAINAQGTAVPGLAVTLSGSALTTSQIVTSGTPATITIPSVPGTYTLQAVAGGYTVGTASITVTAPGSLALALIGGQVNGSQTVQVTARNSAGTLETTAVLVTLSGAGISRTVSVTGTQNVPLVLPTTSGTLFARAEGYNTGSVVLPARATGQQQQQQQQQQQTQQQQQQQQQTSGVADSIEIDGSRNLDATVNQALRLRVGVHDANDRGVSGVRVTFRVLAPGKGRLSQRGNGRAVISETDRNGYATASLTPLGGNLIVEAKAAGVRAAVTFIIDVDGSADDRGSSTTDDTRRSTDDTPRSREINPVVHIGASNRPPMLWVDGGKIYALVGANVQEFGSGIAGAMNVAVAGGKVYWTEQTGESSGTINSANLDGTGATELKSITAVPMGIDVDTENSKLYWTNSRGRIQSANLDGSGRVENVRQNLPSPMDLAISRGNLYWTQYDATAGTGSIGIANPTGRGTPKYVSTGSDMPGSLAIHNGKVYWTEMTGTSSGTIHSATLSGTDVKQLASIQAAPSGIAVDAARSKLFWTNSRGRIQSADLNGKKIQNIVDGLGMPGDMVISNSIKAPTEAPEKSTTTAAAGKNKYDINGDGSVDSTDVDALLLAVLAELTNAKYDVNGDGAVDVKDVKAVNANLDTGAAGAPALLGMKISAIQVDRLQAQIDLLIATGDRSPAAMKTLIYLQQLIAMARPEKTQLLANYPNPFNPETWMPYELATDTDVRLTIYNAQGVVVRVLSLGQQSAGYYTDRERAAYWDGRNALGEQVASGIYFYQLETDEISSLRKMVILK